MRPLYFIKFESVVPLYHQIAANSAINSTQPLNLMQEYQDYAL